MFTQFERSEQRLEQRDVKVSRLLKELEQEIVDMVPWRHYAATLNCMREMRRTLIRTRDIVAKNDHELLGEVNTVLEIVTNHLEEPRITEVKYIHRNMETFDPPETVIAKPKRAYKRRTKKKK